MRFLGNTAMEIYVKGDSTDKIIKILKEHKAFSEVRQEKGERQDPTFRNGKDKWEEAKNKGLGYLLSTTKWVAFREAILRGESVASKAKIADLERSFRNAMQA
jgi:hypothetical protein